MNFKNKAQSKRQKSSIDDTSEKINTIKALYPLIMFYKDKIKTLEFILND